ncbi:MULTISPECIES: hypothetical protein [Nocardiopsis]|uniref:CDP-alcohol phosphatidyltransferase n=1 Tax=Nocardiopsis sinuspersici TaxID=501010 RepID=A0A1V3C4K0_9ACTN|nr:MULTISPECIES: hypothetical protein [Nocardiopsis]OOC55409.1 hypothetical protein NOSIN_17630 [Nocardiopsis sinuspersici]
MAEGGTVARLVARTLERGHLTRAGVTRISVLTAVGAAVWFSRADTVGGLAGSAFLGAVLFCDAVRDRMRAHRRDALTLWLTAMLSRLREYTVHLGLAFGAVAAGIDGAWGWAAGALVALALRDSLLTAGSAPAAPWPGQESKRPAPSAQRRTGGLLSDLAPRPPQGSRVSDPVLTSRLFGTTVVTASEEARTRSAGNGGNRPGGSPGHPAAATPAPVRRLLSFPQPARFLTVAVTATLWDARVTFVTLVVGCAVAVTARFADPADHGARR